MPPDILLMAAAGSAVGVMRGLGHDSPILDDDPADLVHRMRAQLRAEAELLQKAVDQFLAAKADG